MVFLKEDGWQQSVFLAAILGAEKATTQFLKYGSNSKLEFKLKKTNKI